MPRALELPRDHPRRLLDEKLERDSGIKTPPYDAPHEVHVQWQVAHQFLIHYRCVKNKKAATIMAANAILADKNYEEKIPYLEMALGRKLTDAEIAARHISN